MKNIKRLSLSIVLVLSVLLFGAFVLTGCGLFGGNDSPKSYVLQYTDDAGTHTINVTQGMPYSISSIPTKYGYDFLGLFDAETGGTQYISADGSSLTTFSGDQNMVLFVRWSPKKYTFILDYQGGSVSGDREIQVTYGEKLPDLPRNVEADHKTFSGWYTKVNCGGVMVADKDGLIPSVSTVNETNFNLDTGVTLYAGFINKTYSVKLDFGSVAQAQTIDVEYGTQVSDLIYSVRDESGRAVLVWSKTQDGAAYDGIIDDNMTLYAKEWAPVIELDVDGGDKLPPVIARANTSVKIPTPTKDLYKFLNWVDEKGDPVTSSNITMPEESFTLKAVWQAKLVFDSNGGSPVDEISVEAGETVKLPLPEREGYIFAHWYDTDGDVYDVTTMPTVGKLLKAGWYKEVVDERVTVTGSTRIQLDSKNITSPSMNNKFCIKIDVSKYTANGPVTIKFDAQCHYWCQDGPATVTAEFYSRNVINSSYLMTTKKFSVGDSTDETLTFNETFTVDDNFYICFYQSKTGPWASWITYFYYNITYPDVSQLII